MNKLILTAFLCFVSLLCAVLPLHAQSRDMWVSGGFTSNRDNAFIGNGYNIGFRLNFNTSGPFSHEFQYTYSQPTFSLSSDHMEIHQVGYNFLYYFKPRESSVRPIVTAGVHLNDFVLPGSVIAPTDKNVKVGFNYGVGLKIRLTPLLGFRADLREYEIGKPDWGGSFTSPGGWLHQTEASAGLGVYF